MCQSPGQIVILIFSIHDHIHMYHHMQVYISSKYIYPCVVYFFVFFVWHCHADVHRVYHMMIFICMQMDVTFVFYAQKWHKCMHYSPDCFILNAWYIHSTQHVFHKHTWQIKSTTTGCMYVYIYIMADCCFAEPKSFT